MSLYEHLPNEVSMTTKVSNILKKNKFPSVDEKKSTQEIELLQKKILDIQQAVWVKNQRVIIVIEGIDAAGKGGVIKIATSSLDPRGYQVHAIGAPTQEELKEHYLQRFWRKIPIKGMITFFDRSWYGRVLVEKVEKLIPAKRIQEAYKEIVQFEQTLVNDGIKIFKFLLIVSKDEQLKRFKARLNDPLKNWKINEDDIKNRSKWNDYIAAMDNMISKTSSVVPWIVIEANDKKFARLEVLRTLHKKLSYLDTSDVKIYSNKKVKGLLKKL